MSRCRRPRVASPRSRCRRICRRRHPQRFEVDRDRCGGRGRGRRRGVVHAGFVRQASRSRDLAGVVGRRRSEPARTGEGQPGREELPRRCRLRGGSPRRRPGNAEAAKIRDEAQTMLGRFDVAIADVRQKLAAAICRARRRSLETARVLDPASPSVVELAAKTGGPRATARCAHDRDRRKSCRADPRRQARANVPLPPSPPAAPAAAPAARTAAPAAAAPRPVPAPPAVTPLPAPPPHCRAA